MTLVEQHVQRFGVSAREASEGLRRIAEHLRRAGGCVERRDPNTGAIVSLVRLVGDAVIVRDGDEERPVPFGAWLTWARPRREPAGGDEA